MSPLTKRTLKLMVQGIGWLVLCLSVLIGLCYLVVRHTEAFFGVVVVLILLCGVGSLCMDCLKRARIELAAEAKARRATEETQRRLDLENES